MKSKYYYTSQGIRLSSESSVRFWERAEIQKYRCAKALEKSIPNKALSRFVMMTYSKDTDYLIS